MRHSLVFCSLMQLQLVQLFPQPCDLKRGSEPGSPVQTGQMFSFGANPLESALHWQKSFVCRRFNWQCTSIPIIMSAPFEDQCNAQVNKLLETIVYPAIESAINCIPIGNPLENANGTDIAGLPVRFASTVFESVKNCDIESSIFSPILNGNVGTVGASSMSNFFKCLCNFF